MTADIGAAGAIRRPSPHFADKREVLFDGELELSAIFTEAVEQAPADLPALPVLVLAFTAAVPLLVANRRIAQQRARIIAVTPALQERAHAKTTVLTPGEALLLDELLARLGSP